MRIALCTLYASTTVLLLVLLPPQCGSTVAHSGTSSTTSNAPGSSYVFSKTALASTCSDSLVGKTLPSHSVGRGFKSRLFNFFFFFFFFGRFLLWYSTRKTWCNFRRVAYFSHKNVFFTFPMCKSRCWCNFGDGGGNPPRENRIFISCDLVVSPPNTLLTWHPD